MKYFISGGLQVSDGRGNSWIVPEYAINQDFIYHINKLVYYSGQESELIPERVTIEHSDEQVISWIERLRNFTPRTEKEKEFVSNKIVQFRQRFCGNNIPTPTFVWK